MRCIVAVVTGLMTIAAWAQNGAEATAYDSFEDAAAPLHWASSREGTLSVSDRHFKHGTQALRWDFQKNDTLRVRADLGDINRYGGYGGTYSKATFGIWVYCPQPLEGSLRLDFRSNEETDAWFKFPLNFSGWRRAHLKYTVAPHTHLADTRWAVEFEGHVQPTTNSIVISAPSQVDSGTVFFDLVVYNGLLDYRRQHVPTANSGEAWKSHRERIDPDLLTLPETITPEENQGVDKLETRLTPAPGDGLQTEAMSALQKQVEAFDIVRDEYGIRGQPLVHSRWMEFYQGIDGVTSAREISLLMLKLARAYHNAYGNTEQRDQIADWYCLLAEHLRDQGMTAGSGFSWGAYNGRELAEGNFLMRQPLRQCGMLDWAEAFLDDSYGHSSLFDDDTIHPHMDYFRNNVRLQLYGSLMQTERAEQVRHLRALGRRLTLAIMHQGPPSANGFKPDGSAFHHNFHYFAYSEGAVAVLANVLEPLSQTPFAISAEAHERIKRVALAMRFFCNRRELPLPLSGRHPFRTQRLRPSLLLTLAKCGSPDRTSDLDPDLAAAYLRLVPEAAAKDSFRQHQISPEVLQGNLTMNYAGLSAHRRDDWLALAKGYSKYVAFGEIYDRNNRFGRYLSNGYLDILGGGEPISQKGSGVVQEGWDWNRLDGTTVIYLPLNKLRAVRSGTESIPSDRRFVGGLSHRGWNALFVMQIQGHETHDPTFRGRKTYFFFDDRILCLGSDIANHDTEHPTHTNLFQKHLENPDEDPVWIDGEALTSMSLQHQLATEHPGWIIDPQGTGYWLKATQTAYVARKHQRSRNQSDTEDTEGNFASAWIDHGHAPDAGWYDYAVIVRATPERMQQFDRAMTNAEQPPYDVLQRNSRAHIVFDRKTGTWGAVLFENQQLEPHLPLLAVDRACLVMIEPADARRLHLSVADPDLNLEAFVSVPRKLRITLRGSWDMATPSNVARIAARKEAQTVIEVTCRDGRSYDLQLVRR